MSNAFPNKRTILLFGKSGAGKSAQVAELAEHVYRTTGLKTRLATCDRGGTETVQPWVDAGIIEVEQFDSSDIWLWANKVSNGYRKVGGKWMLDQAANAKVGMWAFESMRAIGEELMRSMTEKAAQGISIGGAGNIGFTTGDGVESIKVSGSNQAMYGVGQSQITSIVWDSQKLPGHYVVWTSSLSKDVDEFSSSKVLGPDVLGKALTAEVPRWMDLSFRMDVKPANGTIPEKHILYMGTSIDTAAGNATVLGNLRLPLNPDAKPLPTQIEPASIVRALAMIDQAKADAIAAIQKRIAATAK